MKATWDIETAKTCKINNLMPDKCKRCRDYKYCYKQMSIEDIIKEEGEKHDNFN